jgi:hypothetical protein
MTFEASLSDRNPDLYYSTGPCKNGHVGMRLKSNGDCADCKLEQVKRRRKRANWIYLIRKARERAKIDGIPCDLTADWGRARYTGKCEITGIPFERRYQCGHSPFSASIDRIEPDLGYTQKNCRFILFGVNALKSDGTDDEMLTIARALVAASG